MFKYVLGVITVLFFYIIGTEVVGFINKKSANTARLECHKKSTTFEYVYQKEQVNTILDAIKSNHVVIRSKFQLSEHMQTKLANYISLSQVDKMIKDQIDVYKVTDKESDKELLIDYFIYENDKEDPGKKTAKSKLYAGYLVFHFLLEGEKVYRIQIDFMDLQGKDIEEKVGCVFDSVMSLK